MLAVLPTSTLQEINHKPAPVTVKTQHAISKFDQTNGLSPDDCILFDFIDRTPDTPPVSLTSITAGFPEQIRVRISDDSPLQKFLEKLQKQWPDKTTIRQRIEFLMGTVVTTMGGAIASWGDTDDKKASEAMRLLLTESDLPFVFIGDVIGRVMSRAGVAFGCRHRSILMKVVADHTVQYPSSWSNQTLRMELRRVYCKTVHDGKQPHSFNIAHMDDGKTYIIDLERSPTEIISRSLADYEQELQVIPPPPVPSRPQPILPVAGWMVLGKRSALNIKSQSETKTLKFDEMLKPFGITPDLFDAKTVMAAMSVPIDLSMPMTGLPTTPMPVVTMPELSKRFARDRFLAFGDQLRDGFTYESAPNELILFDSTVDNDLAQCVMHARNILRISFGQKNRASVLAKFVSMKLPLPSSTADKIKPLSDLSDKKVGAEQTLPIGQWLARGSGLPAHRALLLKYLADQTVRDPVLWNSSKSKPDSVLCSLQFDQPLKSRRTETAVVTMIMIDGSPFLCDISNPVIKFIDQNGKEFLETKSLDPDNEGMKADTTLHVAYQDLSDYHALRPGMGTAKWKNRTVVIMSTIAGRLYDTSRFVAEMEALANARHYHISRVLGFSFYENIDHKVTANLGQRTGSAVPQMIGVFEHITGPTLFDMLNRENIPIQMEDRVRGCLQVAQSLSHLHGLSISYGNLNPSTIYVDDRSFDLKLAGLDLTRYILRAAIPSNLTLQDVKTKQEADQSAQSNAAYWAIERFMDPLETSFASDVYSLGAIMYSIVTHTKLFKDLSFDAIRTAVQAGQRPVFDRTKHSTVPTDVQRLILDCMSPVYADRPSIEQCIDRLRACIDLGLLMRVTEDMQWHAGQGPVAARTAVERAQIASSVAAVVAPAAEIDAKNGAHPKAATATMTTNALPPTESSTKSKTAEEEAAASAARLKALEEGNGPMEMRFGDQPTVEQCDKAREEAFMKLGLIDKKMLVGEHVATCALYIIHRTHTGNVALVTRGLSDPAGDVSGNTTGLGVELLAEAKESDVGTGKQLGESYLFQMMHEVAGNCRQFGLKLRQLIDVHGLVSMELNNTEAPAMFTDPNTNRTSVLIGIPSPDVIEHFTMPNNKKVLLVTVRLLTFEECIVIRRFGAAGRKAIAELFTRDGTYHVSSIRQSPRPPLDMDIREIKTNPLGSTEAMLLTGRTGDGRTEVVGTPAPPNPSESVYWDDDKVRKRLTELQSKVQPTPVAEAKAVAKATPVTKPAATHTGVIPPALLLAAQPVMSVLPDLERNGRCELDVKAVFPQFAKPTPIANAMSRFDMRMRQIIGSAGHPAQALAKHIQNAMSTQTQLAGWKHVQDFIHDPKTYSEGLKGLHSLEPVPRLPPYVGPIDTLLGTAERLMRRICMRLEWLLDLQTRANEKFDPDLFLHVVALDIKWMDESTSFIRDAEVKVTELLKKNSQRFGLFRDLQKRGVHWPHTTRLRKDIESAGFVFKPMMVKRDRCVCELCGMEVSGWRPWHNPWQMHNLVRHSADFHERVSRFGTAFPQTGLYVFTVGPAQPKPTTVGSATAAAAAGTAATLAAAMPAGTPGPAAGTAATRPAAPPARKL